MSIMQRRRTDNAAPPVCSAADQVACAHCGLPVPAAMREPDHELQFCCNGCRAVFSIIHNLGLSRFYTIRKQEPSARQPAATTGDRFEHFDDDVFHKLHVSSLEDGLSCVEFVLQGVHCIACVWLVEKLPSLEGAVVETRLDMGRSIVRIVWDNRRSRLSRIARRLDSLGYTPHPVRQGALRELRRLEDRKLLIRIGVAGAIAGNVMFIAVALYGGMLHGMASQHEAFFRFLSAGLGVVAIVWPASVFFKGALASIRAHALHMDLPVAIALATGGVWGVWNTLQGAGEIYFDSLTAVIFLLLIGRWIQRREHRAAIDTVELLSSLTPSSACLVEADSVREAPIESICAGDLVETLAGDSIPVDGVITDGVSHVDRSLLTGESKPSPVGPGDTVHAGAVNLTSTIRVRTIATGEQTRVGKLMGVIEDCSRRRAPIVRMADRVAGVFVAVVLALAAFTALLWLAVDPTRAIDNTMALLIVSCPCALGLATPLAVVVAIGRAARAGLFVRGGDALERLAKPGLILLDKTGTLTEGRTSLVDWRGDESFKTIAAAIESCVSHPIARAFVDAAGDSQLQATSEVRQQIGMGVEGNVNGQHLRIGSVRFIMRAHEADDGAAAAPGWVRQAIADMTVRALTPVLIECDGSLVAVAGMGDSIRDDALKSIRRLRRLGWRVGVLSGDHPDVVRAVADELGIDPALCTGAASPERKVEIVEESLQAGPVVMVGDGVNDAAALARATVGVAVQGGAEAAMAASDVFLTHAGLAPIVSLVTGARATVRVIRLNLAVSLVYNAISVALAMAGVINPLIAAVMMPISSLTVITLSHRARTF